MIALVALFALCAVADTWTDSAGKIWSYSVAGDTATVTGVSPANGEIAIPSSVNDYPVTSIGNRAFSNCSGLTGVTIPDGVTSIGNWAFDDCYNLTSVTMPDSVTDLGNCAFYGCSGLRGVTIPAGVTSIGNRAFYGCSGLTSVTIPASVTSIGDSAFYGCHSLRSVTIPDGVTSIGDCAFSGCSGLKGVTIPASVTSIGEYAFSGCKEALFDTTTISGVKLVDGWAVDTTGSLSGHLNLTGIRGIGGCAFAWCSGLTSVTIPASVTRIGDSAFEHCRGLRSVTIPYGVTSIAEKAFFGCSGLTSVTIPSCVMSIGDGAFSGCNKDLFDKTTIPGVKLVDGWAVDTTLSRLSGPLNLTGIRGIGDAAFSDCSGLTSVTIPASVVRIGDRAFDDCSGLTSVTILDGVTSIGEYAFAWCSGLTSVTIPSSVTSIGSGAFHGCDGLTSVAIPVSVTRIGKSAFSNCNKSLCDTTTIPGAKLVDGWAIGTTGSLSGPLNLTGIRGIGDGAFEGCCNLTGVTIPDSVTRIGDGVFACCWGLTSVTIGDGVTSIGERSFSDCNGLRGVTIPASVTSIGDGAFSGCRGLRRVELLSGVVAASKTLKELFPDAYDRLTVVVLGPEVANLADGFFDGCNVLSLRILLPGETVTGPSYRLVPGAAVSLDFPELVGYAAKGLPAGLKFNAKTGAITGAATKPTAEGGVTVTFTKRGAETYTTQIVVGPFPVLSVAAPDAPESCKVSGTGAYAAGRKVTLRATAAKGFVFAGWYADADFETPLAGDVDFRSPSYSYVMPTEDVALFARFVPADEDAAALLLPPVASECAPKEAIEPIAIDVKGCVSLPTVKVTGLPPGLKFTAKALDVKATKTAPAAHYAANTIYGAPTRSGVYAATVTVTTAGKRTATETIPFAVVDRAKGEYVLKIASDATKGRVTGAGVYAAGKKVTLRATPAKGFIFAGWYADADFETPLAGDVDFRTPSYPYVMPGSDVSVRARFVPAEEDGSIALSVNGQTTTESASGVRFSTSGELSLVLCVESASLPKVAIWGLPAGLKFTAKRIRNKDGSVLAEANTVYGTATRPGTYVVTVKITNAAVKKAVERRFAIAVDNLTDANGLLLVTDAASGEPVPLRNARGEKYTVYAGVSEHELPAIAANDPADRLTVSGLPAGLKYDAKLGEITGVPTKAGFYTVTATVRSGRESSVSTFTVEVVAMPEWAVGTYVGFGICELGDYTPFTNNLHWTFTVAANGRVSGKVVFGTGDDRLLTATFFRPSLERYNKWSECYSCDVRILLKDGRDVVVDQVRRLCIAPSGVEGLYEKRIGSAWMHDRVDEETGEADWDGTILMAFQNAWKRKGFEGLPQFAEKKTTVSVTDAALPPDPSEPEVDPGTADLTLDIAQNGTVTATLTLRDGGRARKLVTKGDLIVYTADYDEYGTLVYSACVSLVFGNLGLLHARVEMEALKDGKVHAEGREIVSVDRF